MTEPRIFTNKPKWAGLEEVDRNPRNVKFKTLSGYILVSTLDVDEYNKKRKK